MIELPRACMRADEIAGAPTSSPSERTTSPRRRSASRDDAEGKFLTRYLEDGVLERNPFEILDQAGVGDLMKIAVERGRSTRPDIQARHLRRARWRAVVGRLLPRARA